MDSAGGIVDIDSTSCSMSQRNQAMGMMERNQGIVLGMDQQNRSTVGVFFRISPGSYPAIRTSDKRLAIVRVKQHLSTEQRQAGEDGKQGPHLPRQAAVS